jgi:dihydropteroate synthase
VLSRKHFVVSARNLRLELGERTLLMGILNVTLDSFSGDGQIGVRAAVRRALRMVQEGADIIDVGGESTRPGAGRLGAKVEARRVVPVIREIVQQTGAPVSVDTYKPDVALAALDAGASIVNVVRGTPVSARLLQIVKRFGAAIILMHMRGTPRTMQSRTDYDDVIKDIVDELKKSVEKCLETGIKKESILVDPGIGFAKTAGQSLEIIRRLQEFRILGRPVLIGPSRKSFIGKTLDLPVEKRLIGTAAAVAASIMNGAHIIRVHDVKDMKQVAAMVDAILTA